jgi:hypothetical protein
MRTWGILMMDCCVGFHGVGKVMGMDELLSLLRRYHRLHCRY